MSEGDSELFGIIGGTGLYRLDGIEEVDTVDVATPFGPPSAGIVTGRLGSARAAFLPRHGADHRLLPGEINARANIWALKAVGVRRILSVSAVGSLALHIKPGELALPSQYLDFTKGSRAHTFFGNGLVAHISTAEPTCDRLALAVQDAAAALSVTIHTGCTYACVEGPRLGNKAESAMFRSVGAQLVGMTNVPEVYLAREAQLCYCTVGVVTDYDCWMEDPSQHVSVDMVFAQHKKSLGRVQEIIRRLLAAPSMSEECVCRRSLEHAVLTPVDALTREQREYLRFLKS